MCYVLCVMCYVLCAMCYIFSTSHLQHGTYHLAHTTWHLPLTTYPYLVLKMPDTGHHHSQEKYKTDNIESLFHFQPPVLDEFTLILYDACYANMVKLLPL